MSDLKVTNIQHASATSPNIVLGSDGSVAVGGGNISPQTGFKNRIINGDMRIDQRNAGAALSVVDNNPPAYAVDRFRSQGDPSGGVFTVQQSSTAPAGFVNSIVATVTTANTSLASNQRYRVSQRIEGANISDLAWGSASAKTITLSFWVRSSVTGTFGGSIINSDGTRSYPFSYAISSANTFEQKLITIPGDTAGTWLTNNGIGLSVIWSFGMGSSFQGTANSWQAGDLETITGETQLIGVLNATFYITGVQLEKGSVATPFEFRSIGQEELLCKRYFEVWKGEGFNAATSGGCVATNGVDANYQFFVEKRASVTASISTAGDFYIAGGNWGTPLTCNSVGFLYSTAKNVFIQARSATSSLTLGHAGVFGSNNTSNARINFSAEL